MRHRSLITGRLLEEVGDLPNNVIEVKVEGCYEKERLVKRFGLFNMKSSKKEKEEKFLETRCDDS